MNAKRPYTMTARAESAERTRLAILDAVVVLAQTRRLADISLDVVAETAGVSVQTVLRRFGSRVALIEAAATHAAEQVTEERRTPVGDVAAAVAVVIDHYELRGDGVVLLLAQESTDALVAGITERGRRLHREWNERVFAPFLPDGRRERSALLDLLTVATDVYTWKQLRRDLGLDQPTTRRRMHQLVTALIEKETP